MYNCVLLFLFVFLATVQMIHAHSVASGSDYVELNWTRPNFQPERYQLKYVCTSKPMCTFSDDINNYIRTQAQNLSSDTTFFTILNLRPCSICMLFLLAVYNPASIDSGLAITGSTLDRDVRNVSSG